VQVWDWWQGVSERTKLTPILPMSSSEPTSESNAEPVVIPDHRRLAPWLDITGKALLGSVAGIYVAGYVVRSLYLARYGLLPLEVLRPHYILTGMWFLLPLLVPPGLFVFLIASGFVAWWQVERTEPKARFAILRRAFDSMACLMLILMPLLSAIAIGVGLWALPSELIDMRPLMANPWAIVKDLLPMIIMFTVAMALLASVFYSYGRRVDDEADSELRSRAPVLGLTGAGIGLTTGICYLVWFTFNVFPLIPQTVGGGKPVIIQLIRSPEVLSDLSQLNARLMPKCELLAEDDHTYAVRWSGAEETILRLDRSHYAGYQVVLGRGNARQPAGDR